MRQITKDRRGSGGATTLRRLAFLPAVFFGVVLSVGCEFRRHETGPTSDAVSPEPDPVEVISDMLLASAASWNAGDLDGFMDDYWRSQDLTFSGANGVTRGWENVRERYLQTYWAPGAARDSLRFEDLEVRSLGDGCALVLGRYVLFQPERSEDPNLSGFFSLVLRWVDGGWKIVHDHTSATPMEEDPGEGGT